MIRKFILRNVKIIVLLLLVLLGTTVSQLSYASEQIDKFGNIDEAGYIEIEIVEDINLLDTEKDFSYAKSSISDYEGASLDSRYILHTIPSINS